MNYTTNDRGERVIAEGAPASEARVRVEWPALIERVNAIYRENVMDYGARVDLAIEAIRAAGIRSPLETRSLLAVSAYAGEPAGSVTALVIGGV